MTRTPTQSHIERGTFSAFLQGSLSTEEARRVDDHLRSPCLPCLLMGRDLIRRQKSQGGKELAAAFFTERGDEASVREDLKAYAAWIQGKATLIEAEEVAAPALLAELMLRPAPARREAVRSSQRYQLLALSEILRRESWQEGFRDIARALELAELAVEVSDCLETDFYGPRLVSDARALGNAIAGNARRIAGDLFGAERALRSASDFVERGTGDLTVQAEILSLLASLRTDQSRFIEAVDLLESCVEIYRDLDMPEFLARGLVQLGRAVGHGGEPQRAVELLEQAVELLGDAEDSSLAFLARHNIVAFLNDAGKHEDAARSLRAILPEYEKFADDRPMQIRRRWLEGRIHEGLGELDEAATALREVRGIFAEEERAFDNALVTLDLAAVYLQAGKTDEVKRLAEEMYPVFRSQDVHRHAVAALILFKQAAATEAATVALVRDLSRYLTRARNNPYLKYEPSEPVS